MYYALVLGFVFSKFSRSAQWSDLIISIIIPLYNEAENVEHYGENLFPVIDAIEKKTGEVFEFIFVDDGSRDDTLARSTGSPE